MDRGAWWATVHGIAKNLTWLSAWTLTNILWPQSWFHCVLSRHLCDLEWFMSVSQLGGIYHFVFCLSLPQEHLSDTFQYKGVPVSFSHRNLFCWAVITIFLGRWSVYSVSPPEYRVRRNGSQCPPRDPPVPSREWTKARTCLQLRNCPPALKGAALSLKRTNHSPLHHKAQSSR